MDAAFFLRQRTRFIHNYYITGVRPFREIQRKIEAEESPYDEPPSSFDPEYGEPAFLEEWCEAADAAQIVGRSAISLLSGSLKLYFKALEQQLDFRLSEKDKATATNKGFVAADKNAIGGNLTEQIGRIAQFASKSLRHYGASATKPSGDRLAAEKRGGVCLLTLAARPPKYAVWHKEHFESASPVNWPAHVDGRPDRRSIRRTLSWHPTL